MRYAKMKQDFVTIECSTHLELKKNKQIIYCSF